MTKAKTLILAVVLSLVLLAGITTPIVMVLMPKSSGFNDESGKTLAENAYILTEDLFTADGSVNKTAWIALLNEISSDGTFAGVTGSSAGISTSNHNATTIRNYAYGNKTAGKSLVVTIGGITWIAVYLSQAGETLTYENGGGATAGDKILTLWQATNYENDDTSGTAITSTFGDNTTYYGRGSMSGYPTNLYSTSYIRNVTLNNGGTEGEGYIKITGNANLPSNPTTLNSAPQSASNRYARFTMTSGVTGSLTKYLATPANMSWQKEGQTSTYNGTGHTLNNDNLTVGGSYSGYNYLINGTADTKKHYADWGHDYIWLPSISEAYYDTTNPSIWQCSQNECSSSTDCWLRSAYYSSSISAYSLSSIGSDNDRVNNSQAVRPAVHLNLNSIADYAKFTITTASYANNAGVVTSGGAYTYRTTHTLTATPNEGYEFYAWVINNDLANNTTANPVTFTLTEDVTYTAVFHKKASGVELSNSLAVLLECSNETNLACVGSVTTLGYTNLTADDMQAHIVATPSRGYRFVGWKIDGELSNKYTESAEDVLISDVPNGIIVAYFEKITSS